MTRRFFHGWVVVAAAFVIITMAIGTRGAERPFPVDRGGLPC